MTPQIADLDRCQHGRHIQDLCLGETCKRYNSLATADFRKGNPGNPHIDDIIGYQVGGMPFTVRDLLNALDPERAARFT